MWLFFIDIPRQICRKRSAGKFVVHILKIFMFHELERQTLLEQVGIFDPLMMQVLNRQSEKLRAGANYHLLGTHARHRGTRPGAIRATTQ
jgi:hypothetical protein